VNDHAPGKTVVRGKVKNGEVVDLIAIKLRRLVMLPGERKDAT